MTASAETASDADLPETEIEVQDFSLEEAHFSGCNLSGLNMSFESGVSLPVAAAKTSPAKNSDGLYTLAFISDLAKKLEVK